MDEELEIRINELQMKVEEEITQHLLNKKRPLSSRLDAQYAIETSFETIKNLLNELQIEI